MNTKSSFLIPTAVGFLALATCSPSNQNESVPGGLEPREVIDLGALVTEDLPERVWGKGLLAAHGYTRQNKFEVIDWEFELAGGSVSGSSSLSRGAAASFSESNGDSIGHSMPMSGSFQITPNSPLGS